MANYQNILRQAHQAIADVANNADSWRAFLRSAAYTTHYAFPNQALIYSQRPGATMLADIDTWNRAAGRWVNRGARGVASLGTGHMAGNVRYLFDIKDTHPAGKGAKPLGWQINDANRYPTLQALQEKHSAESLPEIFSLQAALFVAQHGKQLDADLQNAVIGSTLEWAKPQEQTTIFANLITQSAVYMAAVRCGLGDSAVPQDAFADIDRFDTESAVLALGNAVNRAGRQMFAEIGAVVKSIDSVAKPQPKQYDVNVSKTNQQEVQDHGYDESERVSGTQDGNEGNAQTAGRQNRSAAGEVPAREPLPAVRQDVAGRDTVQRPETDRAALLEAGGADHHEAAGQQPGTGQEQRPVGLDGAHEQSASEGGGIGDAHRDEPVNTEPTTAESEPSPSAVSVSDEIELPESVGRGNLAEETAAAIGLPAPEQQQETIRQLQSRASWQPPIKDDGTHIDEQDIVDVLVMGSGFCEGRFRIQEFFSATVLPTVKEQADWLKKEYGIGGRTWDFRDGERGFLDYDAKGLRIKRYASDNAPDYFRLLPWNEVARRLHLLVHNDQYLDENNKQGYEKWEAEQQAKRDARQAEIDYAQKTIADFCEREGLGEPDFSDFTHIDLAYSTTGDGEHEIQVYANFLRNEIVYLVDGSFVDSARFDNTRALAKEGVEDVEFSQFIDDAESAYEAYQERHKPKPVEKRPLAVGDTVYLENNHPFTVEEIGIFDVHLRDEDFPLIGRAVNRGKFARLLAANPKNNALAAPELPNLPGVGEAAEVIEGEVLEPVDEPAEETSSGFGEQVLQAAELIALKEAYLPNNYIPPQDPAPPRTPREKFAANITAIRTLKSIEKRMADGGPHANGEEQEILAQYSGWGGLSDAFEPNKDSWHSEYTELKSLLTEEEYAAARSSTLTAFYTPPEVIDAMYTTLRKMGVGAGTILEPSMGVGAFFGQSHSYLYEPTTRLFGVELDSLTGRIARQLYQKANIQITGFEKADLPDNFFDVVIGNVPFGDYSVVDPQYNRLHFKIHDYFFAKSIDKLRTGGIIAFITTSGTLDKKSEEVRKYIYKTDLESGKYLAGAVFNLYTADDIYDADGSLVFAAGELVATSPETNADGTTYFDCDIPIRGEQYGSSTHKDAATNSGKYIIEEIRAPLGYYVNEEPMEVTFTYDGQAVQVLESTCTDKPTEMWVSKRDLTNDEELPGATLIIQDAAGNVVTSWVSTDTPHRVAGLYLGETYTLTETRPADGYALADEITFRLLQKVDEDGSNLQEAEVYYLTEKSLLFWTWDDWKLLDDATVIMRDDTIKAEFSKKDLTTMEELPGAELTITDKDGKEIDRWVSTDKPHYIEKLPAGDYTLTEVKAPDGYAFAESVPFTVLPTGEVQQFEMLDDVIKVEISKKDLTTMEELPGAELTLTDKDGKEIDRWLSSDKPHYIEKLPAGDYTLTEVKAPDGYAFAESVPFTVLPTGEVQRFEMRDDVIKVEISKVDITTNKELPGAELILTNKDGKVVEHWTSTDKPHYIEKLPAGEYTLTEVTAPAGYEIAEDISFTVLPTGEVQRVVMKDAPIPEQPVQPTPPSTPTPTPLIPQTGDTFPLGLFLALAGISLAGLAALIYKCVHCKSVAEHDETETK